MRVVFLLDEKHFLVGVFKMTPMRLNSNKVDLLFKLLTYHSVNLSFNSSVSDIFTTLFQLEVYLKPFRYTNDICDNTKTQKSSATRKTR